MPVAVTRVASGPIPGELAAHSAQPTTASHSTPVAPAYRYPAPRAIREASGTSSGITATGASRQNSGVSRTRPCMKSPPCRIQYTACNTPLSRMNATTAGGLCTRRASRPASPRAGVTGLPGRPRSSSTIKASPTRSIAGAHSR